MGKVKSMNLVPKFEYNLVMIDTLEATEVMRILSSYGEQGWEFRGWHEPPVPISEKIPTLKYGIFMRTKV